jgi:hypothetical protein
MYGPRNVLVVRKNNGKLHYYYSLVHIIILICTIKEMNTREFNPLLEPK